MPLVELFGPDTARIQAARAFYKSLALYLVCLKREAVGRLSAARLWCMGRACAGRRSARIWPIIWAAVRAGLIIPLTILAPVRKGAGKIWVTRALIRRIVRWPALKRPATRP